MLAGISGLLYVQWGNYITPTQVGLLQASLPVIWVAVGGRDSLVAVAVSTYALNWLNYSLSSAGNQYALVIIGVLLVVVMMFFPRGIIVTLARDLPRYGWRATWPPPGRGAEPWRQAPPSRPKRWPNGSAAWSRPTMVTPRRAGGRAALHHRPERCRQVDAVRAAVRHLPAGRRAGSCSKGRDVTAPAAVPARAARASA